MAERDLVGYGGRPPEPRWPGGARIAVQFVLNVEEGGERSILNGDTQSEDYLHEMPGRPARLGERDLSVEGLFEYGSRAGVWRILELFRTRDLPLTAFIVGRALELTPEIGRALSAAGHEVAGHGYRWIDYRTVTEDEERHHIRLTIQIIEQICGRRPVGWYTGRISTNTRRLLREEGGLLYTSDAYNDDLPYWLRETPPQLVIPYTLVNNDARYLLPNGFSSGEDFFQLLKDAFDQMWQEGGIDLKIITEYVLKCQAEQWAVSCLPGPAVGLFVPADTESRRIMNFTSKPVTKLSQVVALPGALEALADAATQPAELLARHQSGDWAEVPPEDAAENELSLKQGFRLLSAYTLPMDQTPAMVNLGMFGQGRSSAVTARKIASIR